MSTYYVLYILGGVQENILISPNDNLVIADFGISRLVECSKTVTGPSTLSGSTRWMAIELIIGPEEETDPDPDAETKMAEPTLDAKEVDSTPDTFASQRKQENPRAQDGDYAEQESDDDSDSNSSSSHDFHTKESDVWAYGMVLYVRSSAYLFFFFGNTNDNLTKELLTRKLPYYQAKNEAQIVKTITSDKYYPIKPREMGSNEWAWDICVKCWNKSPKERPKMSVIVEMLGNGYDVLGRLVAFRALPFFVANAPT